jgi:limonene-1,2-epoxide hydrolase
MQSFDTETFADFYRNFSQYRGSELHTVLRKLYQNDVVFVDPVHQINGLDNTIGYFEQLSAGLNDCRFDIQEITGNGEKMFVAWRMNYAHQKIRGGELLQLDGVTELGISGGKICYHRDYYDMGAMIYEHVPLLGSVIRWLKSRLAGAARSSDNRGELPGSRASRYG